LHFHLHVFQLFYLTWFQGDRNWRESFALTSIGTTCWRCLKWMCNSTKNMQGAADWSFQIFACNDVPPLCFYASGSLAQAYGPLQ
jgi:hypothetical protein